MGHSAHCRVPLHEPISEKDSWDSVDAKNGVTHSKLTTETNIRKSGLNMGPNAQCRVHLRELILESNSWESVDAKNDLPCSNQPTETRDSSVPNSVYPHPKNQDSYFPLVQIFWNLEYKLSRPPWETLLLRSRLLETILAMGPLGPHWVRLST